MTLLISERINASENVQKTRFRWNMMICKVQRCDKSVQIRSFCGPYFPVFSSNTGKYGPEKTSYLDTF